MGIQMILSIMLCIVTGCSADITKRFHRDLQPLAQATRRRLGGGERPVGAALTFECGENGGLNTVEPVDETKGDSFDRLEEKRIKQELAERKARSKGYTS